MIINKKVDKKKLKMCICTIIYVTLLFSKIAKEGGRLQWDLTSDALCSGEHNVLFLKKKKVLKTVIGT